MQILEIKNIDLFFPDPWSFTQKKLTLKSIIIIYSCQDIMP